MFHTSDDSVDIYGNLENVVTDDRVFMIIDLKSACLQLHVDMKLGKYQLQQSDKTGVWVKSWVKIMKILLWLILGK